MTESRKMRGICGNLKVGDRIIVRCPKRYKGTRFKAGKEYKVIINNMCGYPSFDLLGYECCLLGVSCAYINGLKWQYVRRA